MTDAGVATLTTSKNVATKLHTTHIQLHFAIGSDVRFYIKHFQNRQLNTLYIFLNKLFNFKLFVLQKC